MPARPAELEGRAALRLRAPDDVGRRQRLAHEGDAFDGVGGAVSREPGGVEADVSSVAREEECRGGQSLKGRRVV